MTGESVPHVWFLHLTRPYFVVLYFWILFGTFICRAYETNLLANLVKVDLEKQPETIQVRRQGHKTFRCSISFFKKDLLDIKMGLYMWKDSLLTTLFKDSPFPQQQKLFSESLEKHGGYYSTTGVPPDVMEKIQSGDAVTMQLDNSYALYKHQFSLGGEGLFFVPVGYYFRITLPVIHEIQEALIRFLDFGIYWEVLYSLSIFLFPNKSILSFGR